MTEIHVIRDPSPGELERLGVSSWPIWTKEVSAFPWSYDETETCLILEGEVVVTPEDGEPVRISAGDLVTFGRGLRCTWEVLRPVRKHYRFG